MGVIHNTSQNDRSEVGSFQEVYRERVVSPHFSERENGNFNDNDSTADPLEMIPSEQDAEPTAAPELPEPDPVSDQVELVKRRLNELLQMRELVPAERYSTIMGEIHAAPDREQ